MKKFVWLIGAAVVAVAVTASIALAAVTIKQLPSIRFSGNSATVWGGNFSGLGNDPAFGILTVAGIANYTCTNPQGHPSPGQTVPAEGSSGLQQLATLENGRATLPDITASLTAPPTPSAQDVGCGGGGSTKWEVTLDSLQVESAIFEVRWPGENGDIVLRGTARPPQG